MAKDYPDDFARGYDYARQRYGELAARLGRAELLDLAAALFAATGGSADLARGIAAGLEEMARAGGRENEKNREITS